MDVRENQIQKKNIWRTLPLNAQEVEHVGLTGEIKFDAEGYRTDFSLDLVEKVR